MAFSPALTRTRPSSSRVMPIQIGVIAICAVLAAFGPRAGGATLYLPLVGAPGHGALDRALAHGAHLAGTGPAGGILLIGAGSEFYGEALRDGALAIAVPSILCAKQLD